MRTTLVEAFLGKKNASVRYNVHIWFIFSDVTDEQSHENED
jgi:hypothetical protein